MPLSQSHTRRTKLTVGQSINEIADCLIDSRLSAVYVSMGIESTSQPTACSSSPLNRAYLTERYRSCLLLATCLAWAASVVNLGVLAWASAAKDGRVYTSTCTDVENINTAIHLTINALSTILLMSSIYCMRRVTRSSIDGARAQRWWAKVDFQSNRYQKLAKNREAVCWCILAILALTLHVL